MKPDTYYMDKWLALARRALEDANTYAEAGLYDQAIRASNIGQYCMKRRDKAQLKFLSKRTEKAQQTAGTVFCCLLLIVIIHYILTH